MISYIFSSAVQITLKQKISITGFLYSSLEFSMQANVAHDESCLCMPCRIIHLRHYESLHMWELWNLFKESLPKTTSNPLDKAYLENAFLLARHSRRWLQREQNLNKLNVN